MYYEVSVYYKATIEADCFKIDKDELHKFLVFLTTRVHNLQCFNVMVKQAQYEPEDTIINNIYAH